MKYPYQVYHLTIAKYDGETVTGYAGADSLDKVRIRCFAGYDSVQFELIAPSTTVEVDGADVDVNAIQHFNMRPTDVMWVRVNEIPNCTTYYNPVDNVLYTTTNEPVVETPE